MGAWSYSVETQQSGYASKSGPEIKNGRSATVTLPYVVVQSSLLYRVVGRNGETNFQRSPTVWSSPNRQV